MSDFEIWNEDCVTGMAARLEPDSVDLTVTSIPFGNLFTYSGKNEDIGNNSDGVDMRAGQFGLHMRFFVEQLFRVMRPGCNVCVHIQQLVTYRVQHGYMGRRDFRGAVIDLFTSGGFEYTGEVAIPKDPQIIAQRQKLHSLLFITGRRDARKLSPAVNDFILLFTKPGQAEPVPALRDARENPNGWVSTDEWIKWARGTWDDIRETDVLADWQAGREEGDERHVCPLQLEPVRRLVRLYSNPGETVFDPFTGIGTVPFVAIKEGRRGLGFELKESYYRQALRACETAVVRQRDRQAAPADLFALAGVAV